MVEFKELKEDMMIKIGIFDEHYNKKYIPTVCFLANIGGVIRCVYNGIGSKKYIPGKTSYLIDIGKFDNGFYNNLDNIVDLDSIVISSNFNEDDKGEIIETKINCIEELEDGISVKFFYLDEDNNNKETIGHIKKIECNYCLLYNCIGSK